MYTHLLTPHVPSLRYTHVAGTLSNQQTNLSHTHTSPHGHMQIIYPYSHSLTLIRIFTPAWVVLLQHAYRVLFMSCMNVLSPDSCWNQRLSRKPVYHWNQRLSRKPVHHLPGNCCAICPKVCEHRHHRHKHIHIRQKHMYTQHRQKHTHSTDKTHVYIYNTHKEGSCGQRLEGVLTTLTNNATPVSSWWASYTPRYWNSGHMMWSIHWWPPHVCKLTPAHTCRDGCAH